MILQIDAWNMRERDAWGGPAARRGQGQEPGRWHWVYPGTVFGLDYRGQTAGGRPVTSERGFVATRAGSDGLRAQLPAEALRRGRGPAAGALVIADGAVGIWRLAHDRFPPARQRLDFYRAAQHLAAVGRALFGEEAQQLKAGLPPWVQQRKKRVAGERDPAMGRPPAEPAPRPGGAGGGEARRELLSRTPGAAGRPGGAAAGRADRQRPGGSDLPAEPMPFQADRVRGRVWLGKVGEQDWRFGLGIGLGGEDGMEAAGMGAEDDFAAGRDFQWDALRADGGTPRHRQL